MRLAIQDSWPNLPENAEKEFIQRFMIACDSIGVECKPVVTSDDINNYEPDAVLVSHEFSRKLTQIPTIGLIWSPLDFFKDDPYRITSLLSYDGFLTGSSGIRTFLRDLSAGIGAPKPIASELFLPTTYRTEHNALQEVTQPSLSYIGVHWDGARHRDLFDVLAERDIITCYGPTASWQRVAKIHGGYLPFDGRSVINTLASHGLSLCLHKPEHRAENTPSMRIFEACSVGALPICDDIAFARDNLGDIACFIDMKQDAATIADQIESIIAWTRNNPRAAQTRATKAKAWFDANWSLESKIENLILPFVDEVRSAGKFKRGLRPTAATTKPKAIKPACEIVIRSGGREPYYLERALKSVQAANSAEFPLGIIVVDYRSRADLKALAMSFEAPDLPVRYLPSTPTGFRSTALWDGLKAAKAPFVAHMDDDDSVFENHYRQLWDAFTRDQSRKVCYSGVVRVEDDEGIYTSAPNFDGPLGKIIQERRELKFLESFDLNKLARFDNYIQSNTWMARTEFLLSVIGEDPELTVVEDVYLYLLMAAHGPFGFTGSPTAHWHWRSRGSDNSMLAVDNSIWQSCADRVRKRLADVPFRMSATYAQVLTQTDRTRDPVHAAPPAHLGLGDRVQGGLEIKNRLISTGFHEAEIPGIWSRDLNATVMIPVPEDAIKAGCALRIECVGSRGSGADRWMELSLSGGVTKRVNIRDWSEHVVILPIATTASSPVILNVLNSHLISADTSAESRKLGTLITAVSLVAKGAEEAADATPPPPISAAQSIASTPLKNGLARGTIEVHTKEAISFDAGASGVLFVTSNENMLYWSRSLSGQFVLPPKLTGGARRFVFLADSPNAGVPPLTYTIGQASQEHPWIELPIDGAAAFQDYYANADGDYQHLSIVLTGNHLAQSSRAPLYLLMQKQDGRAQLELRPFYGESWKLLFDMGEALEDEHGALRRMIVKNFTALAGPGPNGAEGHADDPTKRREFVAAAVLRVLVFAAIEELAANDYDRTHDFLSWYLREVTPKQT